MATYVAKADHTVWLMPSVFSTVAGAAVLGAVGGGTAAGLLFDAAADEYVASTWDCPASWTTVHVDLFWTNAGAGAGNVAWAANLYHPANGATLATSAGGGATIHTAPAQNVLKVSRLLTGQAITAANLANLLLSRRGANGDDTLANDAAAVGVLITKAS